MAETIYHIRIKKKYAAAVIKDLEKMDAVEFLAEAPVPKWQQKEVRKRIKEYQKHPELLLSEKEAWKIINGK